MKRIYKSEQSGRSMVEMLGVLAIIGVLSVAGIAGYSKAMAKYKVSKTLDQISTLVANIRTIYSGQRSYADLDNGVTLGIGAVPSDMIGTDPKEDINNAFGGTVTIAAGTPNGGFANGGFSINFKKISQDACASLATSDWGSGSNSGLLAMTVNIDPAAAFPAITAAAAAATITKGSNNLPITPAEAAAACAEGMAGDANNNQITWYYF